MSLGIAKRGHKLWGRSRSQCPGLQTFLKHDGHVSSPRGFCVKVEGHCVILCPTNLRVWFSQLASLVSGFRVSMSVPVSACKTTQRAYWVAWTQSWFDALFRSGWVFLDSNQLESAWTL